MTLRTKTRTVQNRLADQIDNLADQTNGLRENVAERAPKVREQLKDHLPEISEATFDKLPDSVGEKLPESVKPSKRSRLKKVVIITVVAGAAGAAFVAVRQRASGGASHQSETPYVPPTPQPAAPTVVDEQAQPSRPRST